MSPDPFATLMTHWETARAAGRDVSAGELCREHPELLPRVAAEIGSRTGETAGPSEASGRLTPAALPERVGDFRVLGLLGEGGMGAVYLAEDTRLGRRAAVKVVRPEVAARPELRARFLREARAAAAVEHDFIVPVWQVGEAAGGAPFIAMPLLQGESLEDRLRRQPVQPVLAVLKVAREVAEGLAAAHAKGLIHRDIKPANVWIEGEPGAPELVKQLRRCKILDFGLARAADGSEAGLTATGAVLGTPAYMPPEQIEGSAVDARADLYSLGVTLYRMATGELPYRGPNALAILAALLTETPPAARTRNPQVPPALSDLIERLMSKRYDGRPASAAEVSAEVRRVIQQVQATRSGATVVTPAAAPVAPVAPSAAPVAGPTPWADLDADDATQPIPKRQAAPARRGGKRGLLLAGSGLLALLAAVGVIVVRVTGPDGKVTTVEVPEGSAVRVDAKGGITVELPKATPAPVAPAPVVVPAGPSPLDALDPAAVPAAERVPGLERELVAVLGSSARKHWGSCTWGAYNPAGTLCATAGHDGVRLWDAKTLAARGFVPMYPAYTVDFSPDGKWLAADGNGQAHLIDLSGPAPRVAHRIAGTLSRGAFGPDGRRFHTSNPLAAWDISGDTPRQVCRAPDGLPELTHLYRLADGRFLTQSLTDRLISTWDLSGDVAKKGWELPVEKFGVGGVKAAAVGVSSDGKTLLVPGRKGDGHAIAVWDVSGPEPRSLGVHELPGAAHGPYPALPATGRVYFTVDNHHPHAYDPAARRVAEETGLHTWWPLALSPDGRSLLSTEHGSLVCAHDGLPDAPAKRELPSADFRGGLVTHDGRFVLGGTSNLSLLEAGGGRLRDLDFVRDRVGHAAANRRGPGVAIVREGELEAFDPADPARPALFRIPGVGTNFVDWNGDRLAAVSADGKSLRVWAVGAGKPTPVASVRPGGDGGVIWGRLSADNQLLGAATPSAGWTIWDIAGKSPRELCRGDGLFHNFLPDGQALIGTGAGGSGFGLVDPRRGPTPGDPVLAGPAPIVSQAARPDGRLAVSYGDGNLWVWDTAARQTTHRLTLPGPCNRLEWAPDGRHLVTSNLNATAYVLRLDPPPGAKAAALPPLDPAWAARVNALAGDAQDAEVNAEFKRRNPAFAGRVHLTRVAGVVKDLNVEGGGVADLTPARAFTELAVLGMGRGVGPELATLEPLRGLRLTHLYFQNGTSVADLSPLAGMPLTELQLPGCPVRDLSPLRGMPLEKLWLIGTSVTDLSPLKGLPLKCLRIDGTAARDLTPVAGAPLTELMVHNPRGDAPADPAPLAGRRIDHVAVSPDRHADLAWLPTMRPKVLGLYVAPGGAVRDLASVRRLASVRAVWFESNSDRPAELMAALRTLTGVETIDDKPAAEFWKAHDAQRPAP